MITRIRTYFNGKFCHYGKRIYTEHWADVNEDYCPICNSKLKLNDTFFLVINNSVLFPNCLVHERCIKDSSIIEGLTFMNFDRVNKQIYEKYQAYKNLYKSWNNDSLVTLRIRDL